MSKRLYKSSTDKQIMGVCAGIADYFNIDPTVVRLAFGIAFFVFGFGFWPYIILGLILPYDYQVNGSSRFTNTTKKTYNDGYVYRNNQENSTQRNIFSSMTGSQKQAPKDVTPKEDDWSDF